MKHTSLPGFEVSRLRITCERWVRLPPRNRPGAQGSSTRSQQTAESRGRRTYSPSSARSMIPNAKRASSQEANRREMMLQFEEHAAGAPAIGAANVAATRPQVAGPGDASARRVNVADKR